MPVQIKTDSDFKDLYKEEVECIHCGKTKSSKEFSLNKDWLTNGGKDCWCKECVSKCTSKKDVMEYFWENNRKWKDEVWGSCLKKAENKASTNEVFIKLNDERKASFLDRLAPQFIPFVANSLSMYKFEDHSKHGTFEEALISGIINTEGDVNEKSYNEFFNGYFKPTELKYLKEYYKKLEIDYDLDTENMRDYGRKLAKQSLLSDKAQDDYAAGKCDFSVVKDSLAQFDMLSKSGNFAACKRKPGDNAGLNSWSEASYKCETSGYPCTRVIEWPKDDVDKTIEEFRYIVSSLGLDQ